MAPSVYNYLRRVFAYQVWDSSINKTLLTLIPKVEILKSMAQFHDISLYTILYKIITKVVINRLKLFFNNLVASTQCSFDLDRHITDNMVIT